MPTPNAGGADKTSLNLASVTTFEGDAIVI